MKTKTYTRLACIMTSVLWATFVSGIAVSAQSDPEEFASVNVHEAFMRMEALMSTVEESARYVAPSDVYDDIRLAWDRLEMLASRTEQEIRYKVPGFEESLAVKFAAKDTNRGNVGDELLSFKKPSKNEQLNGSVMVK